MKIDESCAVTDLLAVVLGDAMTRFNENLEVDNGSITYKNIKLNKPGRANVDDTSGT